MQAFDTAAVKAALDEDGVPVAEERWVCGRCGGDKVQNLVWVDVNTDEVLDDGGFDPWCVDCDDNTEMVTLSDSESGWHQ